MSWFCQDRCKKWHLHSVDQLGTDAGKDKSAKCHVVSYNTDPCHLEIGENLTKHQSFPHKILNSNNFELSGCWAEHNH